MGRSPADFLFDRPRCTLYLRVFGYFGAASASKVATRCMQYILQIYSRVRGSPLALALARYLLGLLSWLSTRVTGRRGNTMKASGALLWRCRIEFQGKNNRLIVGPLTFLNGVRIVMRGDDQTVMIGPKVMFSRGGDIWLEDDESGLVIGDGTKIESAHIASTEGKTITIGSDCMFSTDIEIRNGDSHSIIDVATSSRINPAADVFIRDHVWLGASAVILKGADIGAGSIVGTGAIVSAQTPPQCVVAGVPGKVVKTGVSWVREKI